MPKIDKVEEFKNIANQMCEQYKRKNSDYGDSFSETYRKFGPVSAATRMSDKLNRFSSFIMNKGSYLVKDETFEDTLMDLASYAIMTLIEHRNSKAEQNA